jgi:hypothetical protein
MITLSEKAVLVNLSISQWTARKEDKKITKEVEEKYQAHDAGRYQKALIAQDEIKKLGKFANEARTFHYENTLPWNDQGFRILPTANYLTYTQKIQGFKTAFENAVSIFLDAYPDLVQEAKNRLNGLFNPFDYPPIEEVTRKYGFSVQVNPMPDSSDFRVSLQSDDLEAIRADLEKRIKENTQQAINDLWQRLYNAVNHMATTLEDSEATFRDSLVQNIIDLCELLPRLNLMDDPNLEEMRKEVKNKLTKYNPEELRPKNAKTGIEEGYRARARDETAEEAKAILKSMEAYFTPPVN